MNKTTLFIMILLGLAAVVLPSYAEDKKKIYKYTDENGVTHYSETKPNEKYEEADLPPLSIVPSTPIRDQGVYSDSSEQEEVVDPTEVEKFEILEPVKEQNIWGTGGKLNIKVSPLTEAQLENKQIQFIIDGEKKPPVDGTTQTYDEIYRGEHTVQAVLINRFTKKVLKKTEQVKFFMHQNSIK